MPRLVFGWFVVVASTALLFTLFELVVPRRRAPIPWRAIAIGAALLAVNAAVSTALASAPARSTIARGIVALVAVEAATYWLHRALHAVPALWRFHRVHHAREPLTWSMAWRHHPVDVALFTLAIAGTTHLVAAPLPGVLGSLLLLRAWNVVLHANIAWPASVLDRIVATPSFHARHHREDLAAANFAATLPALDRVFGTWAA